MVQQVKVLAVKQTEFDPQWKGRNKLFSHLHACAVGWTHAHTE